MWGDNVEEGNDGDGCGDVVVVVVIMCMWWWSMCTCYTCIHTYIHDIILCVHGCACVRSCTCTYV